MKTMTRYLTILCCLAVTGWCLPENTTLTGVLHSDQGGPSAKSTGEIRLAVKGQIYQLAYQKPYKQMFSNQSCRRPGAVWTVEVKMERDRVGNLLAATCTGERDATISGAIQVVAEYFDLLMRQDHESAFRLFSPSYRASHRISEFIEEARSLDFSLYKTGQQANCLEVQPQTSIDRVFIGAGLECYVRMVGKRAPRSIAFQVVQPPGSSKPAIDAMKILP